MTKREFANWLRANNHTSKRDIACIADDMDNEEHTLVEWLVIMLCLFVDHCENLTNLNEREVRNKKRY